jgi:hypothetical protein
VDGLDGAGEAEALADLGKCEVRLLGEEAAQIPAVGGEDEWFSSAAVMAGADVAGVAALLDELLDEAEGHLETAGNLFAGGVPPVVCLEDALTEIHGNRCHGRIISCPNRSGYIII